MQHGLYQALLVAAGSAAGGVLRWLIGMAAAAWLGSAFPWGTLLINVCGCLLMGWVGTLLSDRLLPGNDELGLLVGVGFCGAFASFSVFELEANKMLSKGDGMLGVLYLGLSVFLGLLAVRLGMILAREPWRGP